MKLETAKIISESKYNEFRTLKNLNFPALDEQLAKVAEQRDQEKAKKEAYEQSIADLEKARMHAECNEFRFPLNFEKIFHKNSLQLSSVSSDLKRQLSLLGEFSQLVEEELSHIDL